MAFDLAVKALSQYYASRPLAPFSGPLRSCAPAQKDFGSAQGEVAPVSNPGARGEDAGDRKPSAARFPRSAKLLRHADFQRVYQKGRRHFAAHMTVFYLRRGEEAARRSSAGDVAVRDALRVGVAVGRTLGGAVERNRIKRRLREAVRYNLALPAPPVDVVINPKKSALRAEFSVLKEEVARAFQVIREKESQRG